MFLVYLDEVVGASFGPACLCGRLAVAGFSLALYKLAGAPCAKVRENTKKGT